MSLKFKRKITKNQTVSHGSAPRRVLKWQWALLVIIILSPFIYLSTTILEEVIEVEAPGMITFDIVNIRTPEAAYVQSVLVKHTQHILHNQMLVQLKQPYLEKQLSLLNGELKAMEILKKDVAGNKLEYLLLEKTELIDQVELLQKNYENLTRYAKKGIIGILDVQNALNEYLNAKRLLKELSSKVFEANSKNRLDSAVMIGKQIRDIKNELIQLNQREENLDIRAPSSGVVTEVNTYKDEYVPQGYKLLTISTNKNLRVTAYLDSRFIEDAKDGQKVTIEFFDGETYPGVISAIPTFTQRQDEITLLRQQENKILINIKFTQELPSKYKIYGLPLKVLFN